MQKNILVVDDEHEIADLVELYLKNEGFTVFKFETAMDALACVQNTDLDFAILDVMLPDMDLSLIHILDQSLNSICKDIIRQGQNQWQGTFSKEKGSDDMLTINITAYDLYICSE